MMVKYLIRRIMMFPINRLEAKVKQTNWYRNSIPNIENYPGNKWYRNHLERNYDIVNLGSSSAVFCFDYTGLPVKAFNLALKPQSMDYSFKVLKQYFSILGQKGIVLIPFCPFSGLSVAGKWTETANDKYYHILDYTLIDNYPDVYKRRAHPLLSNPKEAIKRLVKDVPVSDNYSYNIQCKTDKEFIDNAAVWIKNWMKEFKISDLNAPLSEENRKGRNIRLETVREMIKFCFERSLRPVVVIPPAHPSLNAYFSETFCKNYIYSFIEEINVSGVEVLDYLKSEDFSVNNLFRDAYFMNSQGAKRFTRQVLEDLKLI